MDARDPVALTQALVRCPSVTPDASAAPSTCSQRGLRAARASPASGCASRATAAYRSTISSPAGQRRPASRLRRPCRRGAARRSRALAASTRSRGEIADGRLYGRGAADMKSGVAAFVAAVARAVAEGRPAQGPISLLITGDEEGDAVNGTVKLLAWAAEQGERFDACLVGEPTSPSGWAIWRRSAGAARSWPTLDHARPAGPHRLSASGRQRRASAGGGAAPADRDAARRGHGVVRAVEPAGHLDRHRQSGRQRHPGRGHGAVQHPLQRPPHTCEPGGVAARRRSRRWRRDYALEVDRQCRGVRDRARRAERAAGRQRRGRDRPAAGAHAPPAAPRTRASSSATARWSSSAWSARPCTRRTSTCRSPTSRG